MNRWVALFAGSCVRAVADAGTYEQRAREIETSWRARLGRVRRGSSVDLLLRSLSGAPVVTANGAARMLGRSFTAANNAITVLQASGVLQRVSVGRRNRAFEAPDVIDAFTVLERRLAGGSGIVEGKGWCTCD